MRHVYIFVEGATEAQFLRRILAPELLKDIEIVPAGSSSEIASLARSVLVRRRKPIAVMMNADTLQPDLIAERRESMETMIRAAEASVPVKVIAVVPTTEAWFFAAPEAIGRAFGTPVAQEFIYLGRRDPSGVLQLLAEKYQKNWDSQQSLHQLDEKDLEKIRALPEVSELRTFLEQFQKEDKNVAIAVH
jgi:hypothetical protein